MNLKYSSSWDVCRPSFCHWLWILTFKPGAHVPPIFHPSMSLREPCRSQAPPIRCWINTECPHKTYLPSSLCRSGVVVPVPIEAAAIPEGAIHQKSWLSTGLLVRFPNCIVYYQSRGWGPWLLVYPLEDYFLTLNSFPNLNNISVKLQRLKKKKQIEINKERSHLISRGIFHWPWYGGKQDLLNRRLKER